MLSSEYGWTTEYILSRTFREIDYRLYAIERRHTLEFKTQAGLHGRKTKGLVIPNRVKDIKATDKTQHDLAVERRIKAAYDKRVKEDGRRQAGI